MATPWDEYLKKRKESEESDGNDGATSWEDYKKKRGLTFASANTNSGTGGGQQQSGIQISKPKGFATPMLRTASDTQREAQALNLPQRQYIPHEMNPINPKNSRDMTGKSNVVTGVQMIQYAQQTQKQDPTAQAILAERDLKQKSVDNSPTGLPPRSAAKTETQPLVGMASAALGSDQSFAKYRSLMSEIQQFQHGQDMSEDQVTAYGDRAAELLRDADYSLAWLEKNKSRITGQEYASLKKYYTAQKQSAEYANSIIGWYKEGHSAKVFAEIPSIQQSFVDGTADFDGIGEKAAALHYEVYTLNEKRQEYENDLASLAAGEGPAAIAERQRIQAQLDAVNQQLEVKRGELQVEQDRLMLLGAYTQGYKEQDPQAADKVAKGKEAYETANAEMDAQYKNDYRVTGVQKTEKQFSDINALNDWLQGEWQDIVAEGGADLVTTRNLVNGEYVVTYTVTNDRFLNEAAAMLDARTAYPTAISLDHMNDKQKDTYYYLLGAGYESMAISYANECARAAKNQKSQELSSMVEENPGRIPQMTVLYSLLFPFAGYDIMAGSRYLETGLNVNPNPGIQGQRDAIISGASNWMNSAGTLPEWMNVVAPGLGGKGFGDLFSTVVSGAESYGSAMAFGQFATIPLALSAASSTYNNDIARGIPEEKAKLNGLAAGAAEAVWEYISIGNFLEGKSSGSAIKDVLKQGGFEASEEVATSISNYVMDGLINKDNSQFNQDVERLMSEEGLSYDEAQEKATKSLATDLLFEGFVGFAIGSSMSGGRTRAVYSSADSVIADRGNMDVPVADRIRAEQAYVAAGVTAYDSATEARAKLANWIQNGAEMTLEDQIKGLENYAKNNTEEVATQRAEQVQAANPDANVITSNGTQAYLDLGLDLATAEKAGAVLDGIVKGEITAENMTSNQARALQLNTQIGVDAVRKVLGVEINQRANSVANGGVMAKAVVQQYEQSKAVATPVSQAQQAAQTMSETAEGQNIEAAQAQEMPQMAQPVQQPVQQPAAEQPRSIPRADAVANTDELSYEDLVAATSSVPTMSAEGITSVEATAAQQQRAKAPDWDTFRRNYVAQNKGASYNDAVAAYQDVLQGNQSGETRQSTKTGTVGLERNEYSEQLDKAVTDAVDSLGKLFGLRIRFADLGTDNGYYTIGTNDVVLDIAPSRAGIGKDNAFRFVIAHEIGHAAKDRLGAERWQQFEDYAVKIMGGEKAITAKQQEGEAYADEAVAREDVACDFIGQLLSDKATLDNFCDAIRSGEVQKETARGFMAAVRKILGKLRGKGIKQFDAVTKQLAEKAAKQFGTELETAENAVKAMQQVLSEAARAEKNTTQEGKVSAASPLSERFNEKKSDIRFSLKSPVEQSGGLIAMHTLSDFALRGLAAAESLPMPSIAVVQSGSEGWGNFGENSVLFGQESIDPESDARNTVYNQDAWTPVYGSDLFDQFALDAAQRVNEQVRSEIQEALKGNKEFQKLRRTFDAYAKERLADDRFDLAVQEAKDIVTAAVGWENYSVSERNAADKIITQWDSVTSATERSKLVDNVQRILSDAVFKQAVLRGEDIYEKHPTVEQMKDGYGIADEWHTTDPMNGIFGQSWHELLAKAVLGDISQQSLRKIMESIESFNKSFSRWRLGNGLFELYTDTYDRIGQNRDNEWISAIRANRETYAKNAVERMKAQPPIREDIADTRNVKKMESVDEMRRPENWPREYMEAKPERVVNANEIRGIVYSSDITKEALKDIKELASKYGFPVVRYKAGSDTARAAAVNKLADRNPGIRFSKKSGNEKFNIDNAEKSSYNGSKNKNGGDQYDGNRVAGEVDRGRSDGREVRTAAETGRNVGRGYQVPDRVDLSQTLNKAFEESGVVATELYDYSGDSAAYSSALDAARNADEKNGWCVTPQSPEELKGKKLRMDASNSIGYVLSDGDIEGVFKNQKTNSTRRALNGVIPQAIAEGGTKLDCYGEGLVRNYERFGFIPVARVEFNPEYANPGWDESKGRPFIYMMMHNGDSADAVVRNIGQYDHLSMDQLKSLPTYDKDGYDEAAAYRDSLLESSKKRLSKKSSPETTAYSERYGSEMQTEGQVERAQARAEQRAAEVKQMNEAAAVVEETKAMVSEALETAEKPKTSERANPLLKPKDAGRADFVEMPKTQLDKEVSKISEEQKEAKEQRKAAPLLKNGKPAANVKPKVNAESVQTAVVDIVQQHGAKTDTASVAEKASELTDAFREAAEIAEDINAESAATYLWDKVDSVAEQVFVEGTLHNSETGKTERYDHTYNHQERKSIVDSIKAKMIEAFAQATSSAKTQKQIDRIVQRMNNQVEKALKAAEAKRVRDLAKQAERAEYKAAQQKSQSKESAAKKIDAIRNRYDAKISDLEQKLKALAKEQRKGSKALETEKRKGAAALSKAERRAEQKAERDRKRIEADYQRQLDRLRKAKDAEIKALTQEVALQVFRRGQAGREAEAALRAWRRDAGIDERIISEEDIKTAIKTAEDLAREAEAKNRKPLGAKAASLVKGAYKAFVSDTFELEQFSRRQSREDNLGTMITAYRNGAGIIDAILDRHLVDPDGNVIDNRSLADVLLVTKNGKPDADAQALLGEYSYHKHGVDRMSIEKRAAENMQRFLKQHPEYEARHGLVATGTLDRATSITEKDGSVRKKSPAQLRPLSYKEILTRAMNGDTVAQEYIALAKAFSEAKDKPLMGTKDGRSINAATHQAIVDNMEASNPWLAQKHAEIMAWWDKFMRAWSVGPFGTLTQYEALMKMYPNYVPTFRVLEKKSGGLRSKNSIDVDSPFQKATGSHLDLRSMEENYAAQVANVVRQARQNDMWLNVRMETIVGDSDISDYARYPGFHNGSAIDYYSFFEDETAPEDQDLKAGNFVEEKGYVKWYGYSNGVREHIEISKDMYDGLLSLMNATKADSVEFLQKATKVGRALSAPLRATATDYSPVFPITNLIKDFQSAIIYGGFGMVPHEFAAAARMLGYEFGDILNIAKKIALKKSSDAENTKFVRFVDAVNATLQENSRWQTFLDLGGKYSTRSSNEFNLAERRGSFRHATEYKLGSKPKRAAMIAKQGVSKVTSALGALGEFTESVTRFAAFNRYLDKHGDSAESRKAAMKEAAEITVDFSRHGSVGKYLNAFTPYLNASIQSIDKFFREVATRKGAERWHLLKRGAIMGTVPTLILMLAVIGLMDDDEEEVYRNLNQRTRDAYYSIPLEDGTAITIPKERQYAQLLGNVIERVVLWATDGDENSQLKNYFSEYLDTSIETNFVPNIPIWDSPIIGTLIDIGRNEDFAGRAIVPAKFKGAAPKDQYDETTSAFAIWMGKTFGVSPMVVDYWITDNFASYGDTFVALTNEAENDGNIWDLFLGSYIQAFSADTAYSSRISEQYYNMRNGLSEKKEGERLHLPEDEYENSFTLEVYRAIEKFNDDITDINDLIKVTEDEDEKRALKFAAQKIMEEALDFYERCMNGEIEDPVLYLTYEPYGDAIRDELTRLDEYNGEDYDYTFVPNPQAPKIGDHKNTDEEKAAYVDIYNRHYTEQVGSVMASLEYQNADDEQKLNYLEEARELAYYYSKQEFAQEFGIESETYDPDDATHVYDDLMDAGFTFFDAYEVEQKYKEIRDNKAYQNANVRVTEYNRWIDNHRDWTAVQKRAVRDAYNFTQTQVAEPEKYDALTDTYNLSPDKAASVVSALSGKDYTSAQRNSKIVSMSGLSNAEKYNTLKSYYDTESGASRREKIVAAQKAGIPAQTYVKVWQGMSALESDKDKNGETIRLSLKNKRAEYLRNATGLTDAQKNLIWQEYYNSENERPDGWRYRYS